MITLPKQTIQPAWHQQLAWRQYATQLFRLISRRRDFTMEFRSGNLIAGVEQRQRRLLINPALLPVPARGTRFDPRTEHGRRTLLLRGLIAHEAGHVVFSALKPAAEPLGWVWNALEDERMERLVTRRFPELAADFAFLGDVMLLKDPSATLDLQNACLVWRWAHDRSDFPFQVPEEHQDLWHHQIRPLVEEAWDAHRDDVVLIAQAILDLLPERSTPPSSLPDLRADGGGMEDVQPEERQQPKHAPQNRQEPPQEDQEGGNGTGEKADEQDTGKASAPRSKNGEESGEQEQPGRGRQEPGEEQQDQTDAGQDAASSTPGERQPDLDPSPPGRTPPSQPGHPAAVRSPGEAGQLPSPPPEPQPTPADDLLFQVDGHARKLAGILAPPGRPARREAHRSRGTFRYDRYQQGAERYFRKKVGEEKPAPFLLRLCVDLSSSMGGPRLNAARDAALMLARAGMYARSRLQVIGFATEAREVVPLELPWQDAAQRLSGLRASGGTRLSSALEVAFAGTARPDEQEVLVIICDGELTGYDVQCCARLLEDRRRTWRHAPLTVLPILIGEGVGGTATYLELFGAAHPVMSLDDISRTLKSALTTVRGR
ncbi:VWA domain-containing protein [Deinococcus aluminii]|uniref:VWFA domain-containing protein n=1 Tax=Deinococcus aluminii TaxID=1656885 RepID=A0ABP9XEP3_9DEIO